MNKKDTEPYMSAFFKIHLLTDFAAFVFNRFYRLEIHSLMVGFFDPACELVPQWMKELYLCTVAPVPSL